MGVTTGMAQAKRAGMFASEFAFGPKGLNGQKGADQAGMRGLAERIGY